MFGTTAVYEPTAYGGKKKQSFNKEEAPGGMKKKRALCVRRYS